MQSFNNFMLILNINIDSLVNPIFNTEKEVTTKNSIKNL
jgi:hypothetical protein